jgi:hypothetical protein
MQIFEKTYDGESLHDLGRDISECLDENFNEASSKIPTDEYGFHQGEFTVTITCTPDKPE